MSGQIEIPESLLIAIVGDVVRKRLVVTSAVLAVDGEFQRV
jgi:hypothetical protein